jgi:acetoin utilization deacetylase AcuC-like enzyme
MVRARVQAFYSDRYLLPLPQGHRFPMEKYARLHERVARELPQVRLCEAPAATDAELLRAHDADYVERVASGRLSHAEQRAIGFPWSPAMVERSRRSAGATLAACRTAWREGIAANLAGGTHHAARDRGAGFCVFNDAVVAARAMQAEGLARRVAIIDCDVHQGDGSASIAANDHSIFTLSLHGAKNFPFRKARSDLDVELPDGTQDAAYLEALEGALAEMFRRFSPEVAIYLAGADPYAGDRLGRLSLTREGLAARDAMVLHTCGERAIPLALAMAGGYAEDINDTVAIHFSTVRAAADHWARCASGCLAVSLDSES